MQLKESHATFMLLSIVFISSLFKPTTIKITENTVTIIEDRQVPIYPTNPSKLTEFEATIDTTALQARNVKKNSSNNWMSRYRSAIRFEFNPPR